MNQTNLKDIGLFGKHQHDATGTLTTSLIENFNVQPTIRGKEFFLKIRKPVKEVEYSVQHYIALHTFITGRNDMEIPFLVRSESEPWIQYKGIAMMQEMTAYPHIYEELFLTVIGEPEKIIDERMMPNFDLSFTGAEVDYLDYLLRDGHRVGEAASSIKKKLDARKMNFK